MISVYLKILGHYEANGLIEKVRLIARNKGPNPLTVVLPGGTEQMGGINAGCTCIEQWWAGCLTWSLLHKETVYIAVQVNKGTAIGLSLSSGHRKF